jgi:hypothetical protein
MSRTIRAYRPKMCLRHQSNRPHKVEKALLADISQNFKVNLGNRPLTKEIPEPYDDIPVAGLFENKQVWKHNQLPRPKNRYRPLGLHSTKPPSSSNE